MTEEDFQSRLKIKQDVIDIMRERSKRCWADITRMQGKVAVLKQENNKLRKANEKLRSENEVLTDQIAALRAGQEIAAYPAAVIDPTLTATPDGVAEAMISITVSPTFRVGDRVMHVTDRAGKIVDTKLDDQGQIRVLFDGDKYSLGSFPSNLRLIGNSDSDKHAKPE